MKNSDSLLILKDWSIADNLAVIAGGPSLDLCFDEIEELAKRDTLFLLSDIICQQFIRKFPKSKRLIFSVEGRYHGYLRSLVGEKIAFYVHARKNNLPRKSNKIYNFHFDFDERIEKIENSFMMKSPGTVAGPSIYWALYLALNSGKISNLFLIGLDFFYIENQIYNRLCLFNQNRNYFENRETREWIGLLQRSSSIITWQNIIVKTSMEFNKTRENMNILFNSFRNNLNIYDFSPLGVSSENVKKLIPEKIKSELSAT